MKQMSAPVLGGFIAALAGLALAFTPWAWAGIVLGVVGAAVADRRSVRAASQAKMLLSLAAHMLLAVTAGLVFNPLFGAGLGLIFIGHMGRGLFHNAIGLTGYWWLDPLLTLPGLGLLIWGALSAPAWLMLLPAAWAMNHIMMATMSMKMYLSILKAKAGGYAVEPGKLAPEFTLTDQDGQPISLASFKGQGHAMLVFVRGDWCPSCHITLRSYARNKEKFQAKGVTLLAIGPDPVGVNLRMVQELGVPYRMLSDEGQRTAMAYGVQMDDPVSKMMKADGVPLPASFLVDKSGVVRYTSRPERAGEFLSPETIFPVLEALGA